MDRHVGAWLKGVRRLHGVHPAGCDLSDPEDGSSTASGQRPSQRLTSVSSNDPDQTANAVFFYAGRRVTSWPASRALAALPACHSLLRLPEQAALA